MHIQSSSHSIDICFCSLNYNVMNSFSPEGLHLSHKDDDWLNSESYWQDNEFENTDDPEADWDNDDEWDDDEDEEDWEEDDDEWDDDEDEEDWEEDDDEWDDDEDEEDWDEYEWDDEVDEDDYIDYDSEDYDYDEWN